MHAAAPGDLEGSVKFLNSLLALTLCGISTPSAVPEKDRVAHTRAFERWLERYYDRPRGRGTRRFRADSGVRRLHLAPARAWHVGAKVAPGAFRPSPTGRGPSRPAIQNIPIRTETGRKISEAFRAS